MDGMCDERAYEFTEELVRCGVTVCSFELVLPTSLMTTDMRRVHGWDTDVCR